MIWKKVIYKVSCSKIPWGKSEKEKMIQLGAIVHTAVKVHTDGRGLVLRGKEGK